MVMADLELNQVFDGGKVEAVSFGNKIDANAALDHSRNEREVSKPNVDVLVHL